MPQLDINTFLIQYVSLLLLILFVYTLLSYFVLPITLRSMIFRSKISTTANEAISDLNLNQTKSKLRISLKLLQNAKLLLKSAGISNNSTAGTNIINSNSVVSTTYISYLIFLTSVENKNEN